MLLALDRPLQPRGRMSKSRKPPDPAEPPTPHALAQRRYRRRAREGKVRVTLDLDEWEIDLLHRHDCLALGELENPGAIARGVHLFFGSVEDA
jgi:hypothetical protein